MRTSIAAGDVDAFVEGLTIMGTGGGGSPGFGKAILNNDVRQGRELAVISPEDVADDAQVVSGGIMGSTEIIDRLGFDEIVRRWETGFELATATRAMERVLGRHIDYIVPFEVGGLNTPVILTLAARLGIGAVDGDALGRSAPQTQMTSFIGHGISLTPMPLVDSDGNEIVVQRACDPTLPDKLGRHLLSHSTGMGANNHYPMSGRELKRAVVPGTVSKALRLGRDVVATRREGRDCIKTVAGHLDGRHVFTGAVTELVPARREGFYATTVRLKGIDGSPATDAELTIQNETMLLRLDGRLAAIFPDLVCLLDPETGRGILSTELRPGVRVALVAAPCHPRLREAATSEVGRGSFSPTNFGFPELEYRPIDELIPALGLR